MSDEPETKASLFEILMYAVHAEIARQVAVGKVAVGVSLDYELRYVGVDNYQLMRVVLMNLRDNPPQINPPSLSCDYGHEKEDMDKVWRAMIDQILGSSDEMVAV